MTVHQTLDDAARDQAALHALGALSVAEARSYELHLAACRSCKAEVDSLSAVATELSLAAPGIAPPPELRNRLLERIRRTVGPRRTDGPRERDGPRQGSTQPWKSWSPDATSGGFMFVPGVGADWEKTSIDGVVTRRLFSDAANDRVTMLVRMAPGTAYPAHRHGGPEECYVLEGDLRVGGLHMRKGDFQHAETGSEHVVQSTEGGCLLLLVSSRQDTLLE